MPFFVPDIYAQDLGATPNFGALAARSDIIGVILKATQGRQYAPQWFVDNWPRAKVAGMRGVYHFGMPNWSGESQADFMMDLVDRAGGLASSDMAPAWDLEGAAWTSSQQIIDISSGFATRIKQRTGKTAILYTGATVRDRSITNRMGYEKLWTPHLDMSRAGWPLKDYTLWQYAGDGKLYNPASAAYGFPLAIPGWGATDMNVVMSGGTFANSRMGAESALSGGLPLAALGLLGGAALLAYLIGRHQGTW